MSNANVMMTGATGFIGRRLRVQLADRRFHVRATSSAGDVDCEPLDLLWGVTPILELLRDPTPDVVLHLAAAGVDGDRERIGPLVATNVLGTAHLLDAAIELGVRRFIHVTSELATEENDPYGVTKRAAELVVEHAAVCRGIDATNLRLPVVFGPGDASTKLIPMLLEAANRGEPMELRDPGRIRGFLYVDDAVDAVIHAIAPGDTGRLWRVPSAGRCTLATLDCLARDVVADRRAVSEPGFFFPDDALPGWRPTTRLQDGLRLSIRDGAPTARQART